MTWSSSNSLIAAGVAMAAAVPVLALQAPLIAPPAPTLALPVDCDMQADCSIQKYVDRAPGPERQDYRCGRITTDGHDGVDIRLRRMTDFGKNVGVIAAAAGAVLRVRDDMPDVSVRDAGQASLAGRLAGNGVVIDHGGGWQTQYSHLKRGSVAVKPGDRVQTGQRLGAIGLSGNTEFPHLHFEVRQGVRTIDPFAPASLTGCVESGGGLWNADAQRRLGYVEAQVLAAGFVDQNSAPVDARHHTVAPRVYRNPELLILWGTATGAADGDVQSFTITAPNGDVVLARDVRVARGGLDWVGYGGLKRPATGWRPGTYTGTYVLTRNRKNLGSESANILVEQ